MYGANGTVNPLLFFMGSTYLFWVELGGGGGWTKIIFGGGGGGGGGGGLHKYHLWGDNMA